MVNWNLNISILKSFLPELLTVTVSFLIAYLGSWIFFTVAGRYLLSQKWVPSGFQIKNHFSGSVFWLIFAVAIRAALPFNHLTPELEQKLDSTLVVVFIVCFTWAMGKLIDLVKEAFLSKYHLSNPDNLRERKIRTQIQFIVKVLLLLLYFIAVSLILMNFEGIRKIGGSLIASAGLAGVVFGFAAQKSLANLLAGFQIAFTQPIRIDDIVIVEGEWGRIEEITFTYVVIRLWDKRSLIVPITYFLEKPFQNWTRTSGDLLATVTLHADYSLPLAQIRKEFQNFIHTISLWDGKTALVQVTGASDKSVEIRLLMGARSAPEAFDLRCIVREHMITFIQRHFPESLPRFRVAESNPMSSPISSPNSSVERDGAYPISAQTRSLAKQR